jgi:putative phosphoesterase
MRRVSTAKVTSQSVTIQLTRPEPTRLAVVADTHSAPHPDVLRQLRALEPEAILHGGDIGDLKVLEALREIAPVYAVRGNIDEHEKTLADVLIIDVNDVEGSTTRLLLTHIAMAGTRLRAEVAKRAVIEHARLVVCGHSHVPFIGQDKGVTVFNPGSVGPRRFTLPIVYGAIELAEGQMSLRHYDCETGRQWAPR